LGAIEMAQLLRKLRGPSKASPVAAGKGRRK
jgi:hypothetical protein